MRLHSKQPKRHQCHANRWLNRCNWADRGVKLSLYSPVIRSYL